MSKNLPPLPLDVPPVQHLALPTLIGTLERLENMYPNGHFPGMLSPITPIRSSDQLNQVGVKAYQALRQAMLDTRWKDAELLFECQHAALTSWNNAAARWNSTSLMDPFPEQLNIKKFIEIGLHAVEAYLQTRQVQTH